VRGDMGDGIFSAYPGVRYQGSSKKVGIEDAWLDPGKGYHWNNFMLQRWDKLNEDGSTEDVRVLDEYERNVMLIDLTAQPAEIKDLLDRSSSKPSRSNPWARGHLVHALLQEARPRPHRRARSRSRALPQRR
jgi:hypothetical protein